MLLKQYRQMRLLLKAEFPLNEETIMHVSHKKAVKNY